MAEPVLGPLVGAISSQAALAQAIERYTNSGARYDVGLGGLPFVLAVSEGRPYARETADFRTQQIDTTATVGDQSLTGWWTRGQSSFHRGAGVKFYETLDGDEVLSRFKHSVDVDPWTPGQVTLRGATSATGILACRQVLPFRSGFAYLNVGGDVGTNSGGSTNTPIPGVAVGMAVSANGDLLTAVGTTIRRMAPDASSLSTLWTHHVVGRTWEQVYWAKDRIWAVDSTGEWYTLSLAGGTTSASDVLWTSGKPSTWSTWSVAEAPNGVYLATGSQVFLSTVNTSTASPTLTTPVSVASVGAQETISCIASYLGYILVFTNMGARLGRVQNDSIILGQPVTGASFAKLSGVGYRGNLVVAAGQLDGAIRSFEFNVLEQTSELVPAWAAVRRFADLPDSPYGVAIQADGREVYYSDGGVRREGEGHSSGVIETGFHRFGTLERKTFQSVTVRAEGAGGRVAVEVVRRNGSSSALVTLVPAAFEDNQIPLNLTGPTDYVGLRFTLEADEDGNVPTLLGYQLRALPAPRRQRLIQVPVLLYDMEEVGTVQTGHTGWAEERLQALETLESDSSVVQFQDLVTGEAASVAIEKVQFQSTKPVGSSSKSHEGHVVLTLRKVTL